MAVPSSSNRYCRIIFSKQDASHEQVKSPLPLLLISVGAGLRPETVMGIAIASSPADVAQGKN